MQYLINLGISTLVRGTFSTSYNAGLLAMHSNAANLFLLPFFNLFPTGARNLRLSYFLSLRWLVIRSHI